MLPDYINCDSKYVFSCDFFMLPDCKNTCAYAREIGTGIGSSDPETQSRLEKELENE